MIDAQIKLATCEVKCDGDTGTGWLVTPSRVITARHCVYEAISTQAQISVHFDHESASNEIIASVIADDESLDVCILALAREVDIAPIILDEKLPIQGSQFTAFGFPVAKLSVGHRLEGSISQVLDTPRLNLDLDLHVDMSSALTNYAGISGAPLICGGHARGMLRVAIDKSLGAISVARMSAFLQTHAIPIKELPEQEADGEVLAARQVFTEKFELLVSTSSHGYVFIEGAHGIGKSTFCDRYRPLNSSLEHFETYSFTPHRGAVSPMHLAQPEVFFDWLNTVVSSHLTGRTGRVSAKSYPELIVGVSELLEILGQSYVSQEKMAVIFVDAIDEVAKLGQGTLDQFIGLLPSRMPAGVSIAFSAPSYIHLSTALGSRIESGSCIAMPPLEPRSARAFCLDNLVPERVSAAAVRIICERGQGHPLYLRYLVDLANCGTDDEHLAVLPLINGSIRTYYETLWPQLLVDPEAVNLLAIIARLRWGVPTQELVEILQEAERLALVSTLARIQHLLLRHDETTIYHASFADFLIEKTALRELDVQRRLLEYCASRPDTDYGTLNIIYHGLRSGPSEEARTVTMCAQDWVDRCVTLGAEPDALLGDVNEALATATRQGSLVEAVRILLLTQRLQFRYDTLLAQSADLAADSFLALGKPQAAVQHAVRYGHLIIPLQDALRLSLQLIATNESATALDLLEKAEAMIEWELAKQGLTISNFMILFQFRVQLLLLKSRAGDEGAMQKLMMFQGSSAEGIRDSISDKVAREQCLSELTGYFGASMACIATQYIPVSILREHFPSLTTLLEPILIRLLASYQVYCKHFGVAPSRSLLQSIFADVQSLREDHKTQDNKPDLGEVDALVALGAPVALVRVLTDGHFGQLGPVQFIATDNVKMDVSLFTTRMAHWRLASFLENDIPCPETAEIQPDDWGNGVDLLCRALAWCDGSGRRAKDCDDGASLDEVWFNLEQHVFKHLQFLLQHRVKWKDSYGLPEAVFPHIYERLVGLLVNVFPERIGYMLSFVEQRFEDQCGLYSEGFRTILANLLSEVSRMTLETAVGDQAFGLLQRWRDYVLANVKNRYELVPELLTLVPIFAQFDAMEEAYRTYQAVLAVSMGPSWYKEDQLSLMTGALEHVPRDEVLQKGLLSRVAGNLEAAGGEMTFQRFVRYDKASLIGVLSQRGDFLGAVRYFQRQTCGTAEQLLAEATEGSIDRVSPLRGNRFPGCALDEQDALYRILESATPSAHWPLCWALLEIYQFGDHRHLKKSAEAYARLMTQTHSQSDTQRLMLHRLKLISESEFDVTQRQDFISSLRDNLQQEVVEAFAELFGDISHSGETAATPPEVTSFAVVHDTPSEEKEENQAADESVRDAFVMPGMFGTSGSIREADDALARAERLLARGSISAAHTEAIAALGHLQQGGWSIWGKPLSSAARAENILLLQAQSADAVVKLYSPLILNERYDEKWRRADHLIKRLASIATPNERAALIWQTVEHVETMLGDTAAKAREYGFLDEVSASDASAALVELLLAAVDHPQWLRRDKAAELLLWLLESFPQYVPMLGANAFTMTTGNLPDVLCGVLDQLSASNATLLWDRLAPTIDLADIQRNCKHVGRLAVLMRIADRAARKSSSSATEALKSLQATAFQAVDGDADASAVPCPAWAHVVEDEWAELAAMGLATSALAERAANEIREACAPLLVETSIELEQLLAEGFRDRSDHPLGRWKAKVRFALQVAVLPIISKALLPRVEQIFRPYNPVQLRRFRILGFSSPAKVWMAKLTRPEGGFVPMKGDEVYLDFFERIWDGRHCRLFRMTAFFHRWNVSPVLPSSATEFLSTDFPEARSALDMEACAKVKYRPAFFGSFTPASPSAALMRMTGAVGSDLSRANWRIGRAPESYGAGPEHEGCYLAIKRGALRLPPGIEIAWTCEINGIPLGIMSCSI
ncbi:AVAST type 1 anti-phage system protease Avs1b [Gluconobacter sp. GP1]|uniref:AVAST type 1 anti-phage system protease Avs1b n=1 Tax=Gluconobacter sp. GP1 TaxID=3046423 RepID=UPI00293F1436|nr:AVAST type 1 anti-phage system protease Avs1b [Gluconobacter sp. GP1]